MHIYLFIYVYIHDAPKDSNVKVYYIQIIKYSCCITWNVEQTIFGSWNLELIDSFNIYIYIHIHT